MATIFTVTEHVIPGQHIREYPHSTRSDRQEDTLYLAVKQYVPVSTPNPAPQNAITVIGMHGNGFPKEIYEPFYEDLCTALYAQGVVIKAIWLADVSNQGASGVVNENVQGDKTNWFDHSRDVLHMVNHFRDQMTRPIIGIAHSFGCAQMVQLSQLHPRLLSTLVLIEPIIFSPDDFEPGTLNPALPSSFRKDLWLSREAAQQNLSRGFSTWDPRSMDRYIKHGLRPLPTPLYPDANAAITELAAKEQKKRQRRQQQQQQEQKSSAAPSASQNAPSRNDSQTQNQNHDRNRNRNHSHSQSHMDQTASTPTPTKPSPALTQSSPSSTPVTLTTTKHQEAWTFVQINAEPANPHLDSILRPDLDRDLELPHLISRPESRLATQILPYIRPSVLYIYGGASMLSPRKAREDKRSRTGKAAGGSGGHFPPLPGTDGSSFSPSSSPATTTTRTRRNEENEENAVELETLDLTRIHPQSRVESHVIPDQGHLLPFESTALPELITSACAPWITHWHTHWYAEEERVVRGYKSRQSDKSGLRMSKEWLGIVQLPVDAPRPAVDEKKNKEEKAEEGGKVKSKL